MAKWKQSGSNVKTSKAYNFEISSFHLVPFSIWYTQEIPWFHKIQAQKKLIMKKQHNPLLQNKFHLSCPWYFIAKGLSDPSPFACEREFSSFIFQWFANCLACIGYLYRPSSILNFMQFFMELDLDTTDSFWAGVRETDRNHLYLSNAYVQNVNHRNFYLFEFT